MPSETSVVKSENVPLPRSPRQIRNVVFTGNG
jgi:hypothetical protein